MNFVIGVVTGMILLTSVGVLCYILGRESGRNDVVHDELCKQLDLKKRKLAVVNKPRYEMNLDPVSPSIKGDD